MNNRRTFLMGGMGAVLSSPALLGCSSPKVTDYASEKPNLDLKSYFSGMVDAWGMFTDRNGKVVKRFTVEMKCQWDKGQGILDESFYYSDGKQEKRIWTLTDLGQGQYQGVAADVVGTALGQVQGNAFHWQYTLALPIDGHVVNVSMDDWMYLMSDRVMINTTRMSKLGIHLGDVTLSFQKRGA